MNEAAIYADGLSRSFGAIDAVAGLMLDVSASEIFGLVGPDGAGKTTTMRLMAGLLRPTSGSVLVGGVDVAEDPESVHNLLGYQIGRAHV